MKTGREGIEMIMRRRRVLFTGFVVRMEDKRLPKCMVFKELVGGVGSMGRQGKSAYSVS